MRPYLGGVNRYARKIYILRNWYDIYIEVNGIKKHKIIDVPNSFNSPSIMNSLHTLSTEERLKGIQPEDIENLRNLL